MSHSDLRSTLGPDVSRRALLQGLGLGVAGLALAPPVARAALRGADTVEVVWSYANAVDGAASTTPSLNGGIIAVPLYDSTTKATGVNAVDTHTGELAWRWGLGKDSRVYGALASADSVFVAVADGRVVALDAADGTVRWTVDDTVADDVDGPVFGTGNGLLLYPTTDRHLVARTASDGKEQWRKLIPTTTDQNKFTAAPLVVGTTTVLVVHDHVHAFHTNTGVRRWSHQLTHTTQSAAVANDKVLVVDGAYSEKPDDTSYLVALDLSSGDKKWAYPPKGEVGILSAPVVVSGTAYYTDAGGRLHAVDDTGTQLWETAVVEGSQTSRTAAPQVYVAGSTAYVSAFGSSPQLYAVDLSGQDRSIVSVALSVPDATADTHVAIVGVDSGLCYWSPRGTQGPLEVSATRMVDVFRGFQTESELMVEGYSFSSSHAKGYQADTTAWRSVVRLVDSNGAPVVGASVKLWSDSAVTVTVSGTDHAVGPGSATSASLTTDGAGEINVTVDAQATAVQADGPGLGCPPLRLHANFMGAGESVVLYPDQDTHTGLASVKGSDLRSATTYDGSAMLPASTTTKSSDHLASTIRSVMGSTADSMGATQKSALGGASAPTAPSGSVVGSGYIAFPETTTNLLYASTSGSAERTYVPGSGTSWTATIAADDLTFESTPLPIDAKPDPAGLSATFGKGFEDFLEDVVHGVEKIAKITWKAVKGAYQEIKTESGKVFTFVVDTVEKAAAIVAGVLKTVVGDLAKVVQALSSLFDWDDIVALHRQIKSTVQTNLDDLASFAASKADAVASWFGSIEKTVSDTFSAIAGDITGNNRASTSGNPQQVYGLGGAKSMTKTKWASDKVTSQGSSSSSVGASSGAGSGDDTDEFVSALKPVVTVVEEALEKDFATLGSDLTTFLGDITRAIGDPSTFGIDVLVDLVRIVGQIVEDVIGLIGDVAVATLQALEAIVKGVITALDAPIDIPVISTLYPLIAKGAQLSLLDLACLGVAIPTSIVQQALGKASLSSSSTSSASALTGAPGVVGIDLDHNVAFLFAEVWYIVVAACEVAFPVKAGQVSALSLVSAAFALLVTGLEYPGNESDEPTSVTVYWAVNFVPVVTGVAGTLATKLSTSAEQSDGWGRFMDTANFAVATFQMLAVAEAAQDDSSFKGTYGLSEISDYLWLVPYFIKPGAWFGESAAAVVAVVDGIAGVAAAVLNAEDWKYETTSA